MAIPVVKLNTREISKGIFSFTVLHVSVGLAESNEDQFFVRNFFTKSTCDERVNARRSYERWISVTRERERERVERGQRARG